MVIGCSNHTTRLRVLPRATSIVATLAAIGAVVAFGLHAVKHRPTSAQAAHFACGNSAQRGFSTCYAPGTSQTYIQQFEAGLLRSSPNAYSLYGRWTSTATNGSTGASGGPITLTYSFPPDTNTGDPTTSNVINATLNAAFGSTAAWKAVFRSIFDQWSDWSGVTFVEVADDGAAWPGSPGVLGTRGDVRIVALAIDGASNVLAYNYYPSVGDMALDKDENWASPADNYRLMRNVLMHEMGHGLGLQHVLPRDGTKLMEAFLNMGFDGPQDDDIRGAGYYYGDRVEPNDTAAAAVDLASLAAGGTTSVVSLSSNTDADWYYVNVSSTQSLTASATPLGGSYLIGADPGTPATLDTRAINPLRVEIFDQSGATMLRTAAASAAGQSAATAAATPPAGTSRLLIRISTTGATAATQRYALSYAVQNVVVRTLTITSTPSSGATIAAGPADLGGRASATAPVSLNYSDGQSVTLTAPSAYNSRNFIRWTIDGVGQPGGVASASLQMTADHSAAAEYGLGPAVNAGADRELVAGESVQLNCTATGGTPPYTYAWTPSNAVSHAGIANPLAFPTQSTSLAITVTDSAGQTGTDSLTLTVLAPLTVDVGADKTVGAGLPFTLSGAASGGSPPYVYFWQPSTSVASAFESTTTAATNQTTIFTLKVADSAGREASDALYAQVASALSVDAGRDQQIASGSSATLAANVSGGVGPYTFTWTPTGEALTTDGANISVEPRQTSVYTVSVVDGVGQAASDEVQVGVTPALQVAVAVGRSAIDFGETTTLEALVAGGAAPFSYSWTPADGLSAATSSRTDAGPTETTTYRLTVSDRSGQTQTSSATITVQNVPRIAPTSGGLCGAGFVGLTPLALAAFAPLRRFGRRCIRVARCARSVEPTARFPDSQTQCHHLTATHSTPVVHWPAP